MESLIDLLRRYGSDKVGEHSYGEFYQSHFSEIRFMPLKILEIGIKDGASLRAFRNYLPQATIFGIDIDPKSMISGEDRIQTFVCDQSNSSEIVNCCSRFAPFDLILDDGSHVPSDQLTSWQALSTMVSSGGMYVIEDVIDFSIAKNIPHSQIIDLRHKTNRHDDVLVIQKKVKTCEKSS